MKAWRRSGLNDVPRCDTCVEEQAEVAVLVTSIHYLPVNRRRNWRVRSCCGSVRTCLAEPDSTIRPPSRKQTVAATSRAKAIS